MATRRASPGCPQESGQREVRSWDEHGLAEDLALHQLAEGISDLGERPLAMDDRLYPAVRHAAQQFSQVVVGPGVAADDVELEGPDVANVGLRVVARGGAAGQQPAVPLQGAEAFGPGIAAGVIDDDVHTAAASGSRLAVEPVHLRDLILL